MANGLELQVSVRHLVEQAVRGLPQMFNSDAGMFCFKMKKSAGGELVQEGVSPRYTVMTLMGLHRLEKKGLRSPVGVKPIFERLLANTEWVDNIGDLGLLLWLVAEIDPQRLKELANRLQIATALRRFPDARNGVTMHLAWFLTGLSCYALACGGGEETRDLAREGYSLLTRNQGKNGYFGHLSVNASLQGKVRGRIGSFADQVYPIYGMAQFSQAFRDDEAICRASECAAAICEVQGPLGQWWWHYDSVAGTVFEEYPVFSVHQHGMAPMTLAALSKAAGKDFAPWIYRGLQWIDRQNELGVNMEDTTAGVIWRCIRQLPLKRIAGRLLRSHGNGQARNDLAVLFECRPYELGWLLYGLVDFLN
jgi:hypothetical protein